MNDPYHSHRAKDKWPPKNQIVMGLNSLLELFKHDPKKILRIYTSSKFSKDRKSLIISEADKWQVPIVTLSEADMNRMCECDSHQDFAAHVQGRTYYDVKEFLCQVEDLDKVFVLACDQIFDPQNFGAILRCAECFGVDAVAWSKNRGSDITPTVTKSSCGASELLKLIRISNLADAITQFQEAGFEVVAAAFTPDSQNSFHFRFKPKTVLIVGSEGEGIQPLILKRADARIHIPMLGKIESLNVAAATSSLLTSFRLQS